MGKDIGKNIVKTVSGKYSQKCLDHVKKQATVALEATLKRVIQKTAEATGVSIGSKVADRIRKFSKTFPQNFN